MGDRLRIATSSSSSSSSPSSSSIKCLKSTCEIFVYCMRWLKFGNLQMKEAVSQRCSINEVIWKTSQNSQINTRSCHLEVFWQKDVLKNFAKLTDKHLSPSLFFNKILGSKSETARNSPHWRCYLKKVFLKRRAGVSASQNRSSWIIRKIHSKKPALESLFKKVPVLRTCNFI